MRRKSKPNEIFKVNYNRENQFRFKELSFARKENQKTIINNFIETKNRFKILNEKQYYETCFGRLVQSINNDKKYTDNDDNGTVNSCKYSLRRNEINNGRVYNEFQSWQSEYQPSGAAKSSVCCMSCIII